MTTLHLGVVDFPYANLPKDYKKYKMKSGTPGVASTGDVATWLENKYHVMEVFFEDKHQKISDAMENSILGALESLLKGGIATGNPFSTAEDIIATEFKQFLSSRDIENIGIPGVPTQAALDGVSHRFKNPRFKTVGKGKNKRLVKRPRRPSFIDTGVYQASMRAWFD